MNRCMRCMQELEEEWTFCPACGYDRQNPKNPERALPVGTLLHGKYLIGVVLGEGGFGITYVAWDMLIETPIAIKEYFPFGMVTRDTTRHDGNYVANLILIHEEDGEKRYRTGLERFVQEAEILAKFQKQPGVVSVNNFFYENNTAYMVMEPIIGVTLQSYLNDHGGKLSAEETLRMMEPVLKTLEEIHKEGVIHRDISPDNIMVTKDGQMKLIDFGAARFAGVDEEKSLALILKHGYAPEEQYHSDGKQGPWTDVYALSAVIYRMLTGEAPEGTIQRMAGKEDRIHKVLVAVPGLPGQVRSGIEKGLALNAGKRYQTIGAFYDRIYDRKKQKIRKRAVGVGIAAIAVLCIAVIGMTERKNKEAEEIFAEAGDTQEESNDNDFLFLDETEETIGEAQEEPENIRALREYYNENGLWQSGRPLFVDLTGDGNDEMIVAQERQTEGYSPLFDVVVYQYRNSDVEAIYQTDDTKWMYYLSVEEDNACFLKKFINVDSAGWDSTSEVYYEMISLRDTENEAANDKEYSDEEMEELITKSVLLMNARGGVLFWSEGKELADDQDILEQKEMFEEALKIAESARKTVLDYAAVYDEDDRCIFAVTGEAVVAYHRIENETYENWSAIYDVNDEIYSVWASHDGQREELDVIYPAEEFAIYYSGEWESKIYQFGKAQHYILELSGAEQWVQYKFCYEDGIARKTDDSRYFEKDENGKVKMLIAGYPNRAIEYGTVPSASNGVLYVTELIDVFYYDHQYVEYGAEVVDISVLEQYGNYREILQEAEENLLKVRTIAQTQESISYERIERAELIYIRKAVNGTYYLNYKIYGKMDGNFYTIYGNVSEVEKEPDADGNYENTVWACVVLEATGNHLEIENQYTGERTEQSGSGLPVYYGADRELKPASRATDELEELIEEKSGKQVVAGSYEDFDGDGQYEVFAFVADSYWAYLTNIFLSSETGCRMAEKNAIGCALWFSDGEQTVQVTDLADGYCELSMDILQFGETLQCSLTRLRPNKYLSIDEILEAGGYATTNCVLENGNPHVIIQDENMRFYQKEDSKEIGCYGPYGTWRPDDSVLYKNGSYYWESDSASVFGELKTVTWSNSFGN